MEKEITILYEDADVMVINKPAGLVVHPAITPRSGARPAHHSDDALRDGKTTEPSVANWVLKKYPDTASVGEPLQLKTLNLKLKTISRPGIVHRLDRETSGALIVAKNQAAFLSLKNQFQSRAVRKIYRAFVYGEMKEDKGVVDRPIGKSRKDFRLFSAQRGARGTLREALTEYEVLARRGDFSFISLMPKTGRTHQIRAHLKAINHPVVSDRLYAPNREPALGFTRLALHAFSIRFKLQNSKELLVEAPYPEDFKRAIKIFGYAGS